MNWRKKIEECLRTGMRFCFDKVLPEQFSEEEFSGIDGSMGFKDHVISLVQDERRKCYKAGFLAGVETVTAEEGDKTVDVAINQITAERKFQEYDK